MTTLATQPVPLASAASRLVETVGETESSLWEILYRVRESVAPVWPLKDYVAVNPFLGMTTKSFLKTRRFLQMFSDAEMLMPLSYYGRQFEQGRFTIDDIHVALDELRTDGVHAATELCARDVIDALKSNQVSEPQHGSESGHCDVAQAAESTGSASAGRMKLLSEVYDEFYDTNWTHTFLEEISRHCAAHYDEGQASWPSPWQGMPLYQAWKSTAIHERRLEFLGVSGFRRFVTALPDSPGEAINRLLKQLDVPPDQWELMLLCVAFSMPGWSAWTRFQTLQAERAGTENQDFIGLLAIRLACDAALAKARGFSAIWHDEHVPQEVVHNEPVPHHSSDDSFLRFVLLRTSEVAWRRKCIGQIDAARRPSPARLRTPGNPLSADDPTIDTSFAGSRHGSASSRRPLAQMVFCIDVRSERFRRHIETVGINVRTYGFAGFFGVPMQFVPLGESSGSARVPALLTPRFEVREAIRGADEASHQQAVNARQRIRSLRMSWKKFQASASGCFGFVETAGVFSGLKMLLKSTRLPLFTSSPSSDGLRKEHLEHLSPAMHGLVEQGLTIERRADLAAAILKGIGITTTFAQLIVFCGHGSQTENNPVQACLDCGACCGHTGDANARFAAMVLNDPEVRMALRERGICLPEDVHFLAALHNTTSDEIQLFDLDLVPESHGGAVNALLESSRRASALTRQERLPTLNAATESDLFRRTGDWSETRPEWGLSGNAAFIVGPRELTQSANLSGRAFLHSYDWQNDQGYRVLEQIMTAPMIVAHWINMQYYASTVDNRHFGSGTKTLHNVVGRFGIFSGNGGDLTTGLPWQCIHDGTDYIHEPLRLLTVIAAPRSAIDSIIARHSLLQDLLCEDWLHLVCFEDGTWYRYSAVVGWESVDTTCSRPEAPATERTSTSSC